MSKATILIVEDEAVVAADLAAKLRRLDYEIAGIAAGGEEAVALAWRLKPDLVLMDIRLDGSMDGIEAAEAIRRRHDAPLIYLTAHSDTATLARAKRTGPFGYILKPFEERELATQIEMALYKHEADREIRRQREWLRVTLTSIGDAVIATDPVGRVTFMNPVAESLTGWKSEEASGWPLPSVFRIVNERTGQALEEPVARVLREGRAVTLANHAVLVTRNGRTVPIEDSAAPILDAAGQVIGAVLVFHDVTEKRRTEESLRESEERINLAVNSAGMGTWDVDVRTGKAIWSENHFRLLGYEPRSGGAATMQMLRSRIHPDDLERVLSEIEHAKRERGLYAPEYRIIRADTGAVVWLSVFGRFLYDKNGDPVRFIGVFFDSTERKQMEEELRKSRDDLELRVQERTAELETYMGKLQESNQALRDFVSIASHDLQEPLRKVITFGNMLSQEYAETLGDQGKDFLNRMLNATARMRSLLKSLLEYSRITAEVEPFREVDLNSVVREVLSDLEVRIERTEGRVDVGELAVVSAEPAQMWLLFQNIIGNALKFHKEGGRPVVKVRGGVTDNGDLRIVIEDNGIGFDDKDLDRVFAPFKRLHGMNSRYEGTGMGLAICRKIVERHGGSITAKSKPGKGSTFIIRLPVTHDRKEGA